MKIFKLPTAQSIAYMRYFKLPNREFSLIFADGADVAFIDEVYDRGDSQLLDVAFNCIWKRQIKKIEERGIHGILFYGLEEKKLYYPTRRDEEAVNPDRSRLRG